MTITLEQFITQLDNSGIISAVDIAAFQESQTPPAESAEDLGKLLVKHKKVTKLQAQMVYQGKGDRLLLGNYIVQKKIGAGGMGDVYLAKHKRMKRKVALKTLPATMTQDQSAIRRFEREVEAAAKLSHPNIVAAHDADEANGIHYFVMEYVDGIDLSAVVKKEGVLKVDVAVDYILQAATGLEYAHEEGIIHRDIKPANLLLDKKGTIKILDMGLARIEDEAHEIPATQLTQDGSVMGTVDYMAPEQAKDTHTADARSDIYSLGCSLYYLLTGESVYRGSTMVNRIMAHQNDPIPSLTGKHILISQDVDTVFQKMVAKKPEDRFQSMSEVINALENCIQMKSSSTVSTEPSDPELQKFLQSQKIASSPTVVMSADAMQAEKPLTDTQNESLTSGFLDHTLGGTSYQPLAKRKQSIGKRGGIIAGVVLASLILIAVIVFKIDTPAGTIVLEVNQPEVAGAMVSVDEQKKINIKTGEGKELIEVVADEKTHTLQVTKGGFETFTKQFTVKAGGKETIKVRLVPLAVATKKKPSAVPPEKSHYALRFQNRSDNVTLPLKHETAGDLTVEAWVTIDENSIEQQNFITNGNSKNGFFLGTMKLKEKETQWSSTIRNNDQYPKLQTKSKVELGKRTNIAITFKGNVAQIYVDGHKKGEMNLKGLEICTDNFFTIGYPSSVNFKGSIDGVRFSNVARYTKDFTPKDHFENDKNTLALYHFDEGKGDVLKDSSGNGHDGKIVGAKWVKVDDELQVVKESKTTHIWPNDQPAPAIAPFTAEEARQYQQAWARHLGVEVETTNSIGMQLRVIPPGEFLMGTRDEEIARLLEEQEARPPNEFYTEWLHNEGPQHSVVLTKPIRIDIYEVTRGQFRQFVNATGYKTDAEKNGKGGLGYKDGKLVQSPEFLWDSKIGFDAEQTDNHPVVNISWNDAMAFCEWLTEKEGVFYRLPTEAEWEFACRAGSLTRYSFGDEHSSMESWGWWGSEDGDYPKPIGQKRRNAFGLFDLHGNALEWCNSKFAPYTTTPKVDPEGSLEENKRILRGGSYLYSAWTARSAFRAGLFPNLYNQYTGFRIVQTFEKPKPTVSDKDNHVMEVDGKTVPPEKSHYALWFQNRSDYVTLPLKHETAGDLTVEAWVTIDEKSIGPPQYISNGTSSIGFHIGTSSMNHGKDLQWATSISNKDQYQLLSSKSKVELGKRTNIAVTYKGNVVQIYVNGQKKGEMNFKGSEIHTDQFITIGTRYITHLPLKGAIHEVRFSNIARYTRDFTPRDHFENDKNTLALYHFDEGSGDVLKDASGNGHDGKIVGAKWVKVDDELQVVKPATTSEKHMTDREIAEWVVSIGGTLRVNNKEDRISRLEDLPKEPFFIISTSFSQNKYMKDYRLRSLKELKQLERLYIEATPVTNAGMQHLAQLTSLTELDISFTSVGDEGLQYLESLKQLKNLTLQGTKITDTGLKHLESMKRLESLNLQETKVTPQGIADLQKALPNCRISSDFETKPPEIKAP